MRVCQFRHFGTYRDTLGSKFEFYKPLVICQPLALYSRIESKLPEVP